MYDRIGVEWRRGSINNVILLPRVLKSSEDSKDVTNNKTKLIHNTMAKY